MNQFSSASRRIDSMLVWVLSDRIKERSERVILFIAIGSFISHLLLIAMVNLRLISFESTFLRNPISAIYTPFSFILVYEVYLLLFYLPKSTSFYIGKQYEIITLIVIRRIFKDLGDLQLIDKWFENKNDLQFTFDAITSLILFFLIYLYYHKIMVIKVPKADTADQSKSHTSSFVVLKKIIALILVPVMLTLACYSFYHWVTANMQSGISGTNVLSYINSVFFDEFFTVLIIVDVLLLLASFFYSDRFHTIIRNSGFVLSTILLKISFSVSGILNNLLIIGAVLFGLLILYIHQLYEKAEQF